MRSHSILDAILVLVLTSIVSLDHSHQVQPHHTDGYVDLDSSADGDSGVQGGNSASAGNSVPDAGNSGANQTLPATDHGSTSFFLVSDWLPLDQLHDLVMVRALRAQSIVLPLLPQGVPQ